MTFAYIPHLIVAGLMGIHCEITTVSKVSVKAGGSISVPCQYEHRYRQNVKHLCKGRFWDFCKYVVSTNKPDSSGKYSISDDPDQRIFTVTINNLTDKDEHFWCAVDKTGPDDKKNFQLSVTTATPSLYMSQQEITVVEGGSVTALCYYKDTNVKEWCRLGSTCVTNQTGSLDGTTVTMNTSVPGVFNVTMSELKTENSGWYWCASEQLQMPVYITVHELPSTTTATVSPSTTSVTATLSTTHQHSSSLSTEPHTAQPTNSTIDGAGGGSQAGHKSSTKVTIIVTTLVLLLLIVPAAFFGWRRITRKKNKPEVCDTTAGSQTPDPDVLYSTIAHDQHVAAQTKDPISTESVTYSTIVVKDNVKQATEPADGSVIYSTVKK